MSIDFERIAESKRVQRRVLAGRPIEEKLRIVEELSERLLATRRDSALPPPAAPWPIPSHWRWARMSEVTRIANGGTPRSDRREYLEGEIPWITPADLAGCVEKEISRGAQSLSAEGLKDSGAELVPAGAVLVSTRTPIGLVAVAANPLATSQGIRALVPGSEVLGEFLRFYLLGARDLISRLASGARFLEISGRNAAGIPVPIPPVDEQRRIIAEVERELDRPEGARREPSLGIIRRVLLGAGLGWDVQSL